MSGDLIESLRLGEVREMPDGLERMAFWKSDGENLRGLELVRVVTVAFRVGRDREWMQATAGSVMGMSLDSWESLRLVEGDPYA